MWRVGTASGRTGTGGSRDGSRQSPVRRMPKHACGVGTVGIPAWNVLVAVRAGSGIGTTTNAKGWAARLFKCGRRRTRRGGEEDEEDEKEEEGGPEVPEGRVE